MPVWLASAVDPFSVMSYVTVALVEESKTTLVTFAPAELARPEPAWALMTEANICPF